jgi:2',5'-phosphodiesterase
MHADLCLAHVQRLAKNQPYILAGDFNIKPSESVYRYLTTGTMSESDPCYPAPFNETHAWKPTMLEPVRSAYAVANSGSEPDFTNYAQVRDDATPFIDTLDYIFIGPHIQVMDVVALPHRDVAGGPFPNAVEPSDHILMAAQLEIPK